MQRYLVGAALLALSLACEAPQALAGGYHAPRTSWGAPNLQGEWTNYSLTHLERPPGLPAVVTNRADIPTIEKVLYDNILPADPLGSRESEWWGEAHMAVIDGQMRTGWITSTPDGRIPYSAEGKRRLDAWRAAAFSNYDGPEVRNASERCLTPTFSTGSPPYLNAPYAANYQIVQTRDAVVLVSEIDGEVKIIRLNSSHGLADRRVWNGDSIGHWEGDTLVVQTEGFHEAESFRAPVFYIPAGAKVTERFTRVSPTEIRYAFSVEDPVAYTQVWKGEMAFHTSHERMFEYACHEGNYSLAGLLEGARYVEREAKAGRPPAP
jgi:hypothetical protein